MPRAIWSGSISFGLVNIPVQLFNAVSRKSVRFNQIDSRNNARIRMKKTNAESGEDVPDEVIVKGYELSKGNYVLLSEDELAALDPESQRTIDIEEFVDLADIDPVYFDASYHLSPDPATVKAYALLARTMEQAGKVGIARFVMRQKQYLAAIRPVDGHLVLSTLVYEDEVNGVDDVPELDKRGRGRRLRQGAGDGRAAGRLAGRHLGAREVPRHLPRAGHGDDRGQGVGRHRLRRGHRGPAAGEGRRPHGGARGQRQGRQGGPRPAPHLRRGREGAAKKKPAARKAPAKKKSA